MKSAPKISVVLPLLTPTKFLRDMTEFTIKTLRAHADDPGFELIVVEADGDHFRKFSDGDFLLANFQAIDLRIDNYLNFTPKIGGVKELNAGIDRATGEFVVFTGNDVIVPPHWDTELLRCFEERHDCGLASLSAFEPGATVGPSTSMDMIVEGMYSPFCMWRRGPFGPLCEMPYRMDERYTKIYQDSDMVMRMYEAGKRAFRSCRAHVHHLCRMTSDRVESQQHQIDLANDEATFYRTWGKSPLAAFGMIRFGRWHYGQEFQSLANPINRHANPVTGKVPE